MYSINYLVRAGVPTCDVVCVYNSIIRAVLEYACPVWQPGLTKTLSKDTERVQRCCLKVLSPALSYAESLSKTGLERLDNRHDMITQSMFREIKNPKHPTPFIICYHLLKCHTAKWFCSHTHTNFLVEGFRTILHFQEILVLMHNL